MGEVAWRLQGETSSELKRKFREEKNEKIKAMKYAHIQDIKKFLEIYQAYHLKDYDYWDHTNAPMFSLFLEKFEKQSQQLEHRASELILGVEPEEKGKFTH